MHLYNITDEQFEEWLNSSPSISELEEALAILRVKREHLWLPGHEDSYHRDRYERDDRYAHRMRLIGRALHPTAYAESSS